MKWAPFLLLIGLAHLVNFSAEIFLYFRLWQNMKELWFFDWDACEKVQILTSIPNRRESHSKFSLNIAGGAKGPGIFFIIPCTDSYQKVDLRTVSFDVPPQEVKWIKRVLQNPNWVQKSELLAFLDLHWVWMIESEINQSQPALKTK